MRGHTLKNALYVLAAAVIAAAVLVGCTNGKTPSPSASANGGVSNADVGQQQYDMQGTTGLYTKQMVTAQPYPTSAMKDSAERANLRARLIRLNDPNRIGYLYGLSSTGQVMAFWTIRGKASSTGSQLSNTENVIPCARSNDAACNVPSMGDDGSFGPEECQSQGVFAFTADTDALIEWCGPWFYSDAPLHLATAPIITLSGQAPTTPVPTGGSTKK